MLKHLSFILKNALRSKRRSVLTVLSIAVSLGLLGILIALYQQLFHPADTSPWQAMRLVVHHRVSLTQDMPASYLQRIRQVPGVVAASTWQWFAGTYKDPQDPKNWFARLGVDPEAFLAVRKDMQLSQAHRQAFLTTQTGAIASKRLVEKHGWKLGERITIVGDIFPVTLELTLVGIFTDAENADDLYYHYRYLQESLSPTSEQRDGIGAFLVLADDPANVSRIAREIDAMFANSPAPTKTESEKDFALSFLAFLGNLKLFLGAVSAAVAFTILLVSANTVAMTVRERVRETAILRTLGFTPGEIRSLILGEAALLSVIGGAIGAAITSVTCFVLKDGSMVRLPAPSVTLVAVVLGVAIVVGLVSAALPALFAARRPVVESLRFAG